MKTPKIGDYYKWSPDDNYITKKTYYYFKVIDDTAIDRYKVQYIKEWPYTETGYFDKDIEKVWIELNLDEYIEIGLMTSKSRFQLLLENSHI